MLAVADVDGKWQDGTIKCHTFIRPIPDPDKIGSARFAVHMQTFSIEILPRQQLAGAWNSAELKSRSMPNHRPLCRRRHHRHPKSRSLRSIRPRPGQQ